MHCLWCVRTFLCYIVQVGGAFDIIYIPHVDLSVSPYHFPPRLWLSNIFENTRFWVHPLSTTNGMLFYKERHTLLLKWFKPFHSIDMEVWHMRGASDSICKPPVCLTVPVSTVPCGWLSSCLQNSRFWVPPQYRKLGWCSTRRDIHCLWSVSKPSLDALIR